MLLTPSHSKKPCTVLLLSGILGGAKHWCAKKHIKSFIIWNTSVKDFQAALCLGDRARMKRSFATQTRACQPRCTRHFGTGELMQIIDLTLGWSDALGNGSVQGNLVAMVTSTLTFTSSYTLLQGKCNHTHNQSFCVLLKFNWEVCHTPCLQYMKVKSPIKKLSSCNKLGMKWQPWCLLKRVQTCRLRCVRDQHKGNRMQSPTQSVTWQTLSNSTI